MKSAPAKPSIQHVSAAQMRRLDARLRARELKLRAEGKLKPKLLLDPANPQLRIVRLYQFG